MGISWLFLNTACWSEKKYVGPKTNKQTNKQTNRVKDQIFGLFGLFKKCIRIMRICQNTALHFRSWSPSAGNRQCLSWHGQSRRRQSLQKGATRNPNKSSRPCRPCRPCRTDTNVASALKIFSEFCIFTADFFSLSLEGWVRAVSELWKCWRRAKVLDESESGGLGRKMRSKDRCIGSSLFLKRLPAPVKNSRQNAKKNAHPLPKTSQKFNNF